MPTDKSLSPYVSIVAGLGLAMALPLLALAQGEPANIRKLKTDEPQSTVTPKEQAAGAKTWPGRPAEPPTTAYGVTRVFDVTVALTDAKDPKDKDSLPSAVFGFKVDRVVNAARMHEQFEYSDGSGFRDASGQAVTCSGIVFQNDKLLRAITEAHEDEHVAQMKELLQEVHDTGRWDSTPNPLTGKRTFKFTIKKAGLATPEQPFTVSVGDTAKLTDNLKLVLDQMAGADAANYAQHRLSSYPEGPARDKGCEKFWELAGKALIEAIGAVDAAAKAADAAVKPINKSIGLPKARSDLDAYLKSKQACGKDTDALKKAADTSVAGARKALDKLKADKKALDEANDKLRAALDAYSDKKHDLLTPGGQAAREAIDNDDPEREAKRRKAYDQFEMLEKTKTAAGKTQDSRPAAFQLKAPPATDGADRMRNDKLKALTADEGTANDAGKAIDDLEPKLKKMEDELASAGAAPAAPCEKPAAPPSGELKSMAPCPPVKPRGGGIAGAINDVAREIEGADCEKR